MGLLRKLEKKSKSRKNILSKKQKKREILNQIKKQREPIKDIIKKNKYKKPNKKEWVRTGILGLDELFYKGIPTGTSTLIAGGAGSGKTILCLQILNNAAINGGKCLYISLEESEFRLKKHMHDFGWNPEILEKKGLLKIVRVDPFFIARSVEALLAKSKGELKMNIKGTGNLIPKNFKPDWIFIDSITALSAAFKEEETTYRIYIEQLFRYLEKSGATSFLISETDQIPVRYSKTGVEEFLADGVLVLYSIKSGNIRENAIEVLKLRGAKHEKKIVAMRVLNNTGIEVYPDQEVFEMEEFEKK